MYEKVSTNLNFVDREKKTEEFWKENDIFRKSMEIVKKVRHTLSMTDRLLQMENRISVMY